MHPISPPMPPSPPATHTAKKRKVDEAQAQDDSLTLSNDIAVDHPSDRKVIHDRGHPHDEPTTSFPSTDSLAHLHGAVEAVDASQLKEYILAKLRGAINVASATRPSATGSPEHWSGGIPSAFSSHHNKPLPQLRHYPPSAHGTHRPSTGPTSISAILADRPSEAAGASSSYKTHQSVSADAASATDLHYRTSHTLTSVDITTALSIVFKDLLDTRPTSTSDLSPLASAGNPTAITHTTAPTETLSTPPSIPSSDCDMRASSITPVEPKKARTSRSTSAPPPSSSSPSSVPPSVSRRAPPAPPTVEEEEELHCARCHVDFSPKVSRSERCLIEHDREACVKVKDSGEGAVWKYGCCGYEYEVSETALSRCDFPTFVSPFAPFSLPQGRVVDGNPCPFHLISTRDLGGR